MLVEAVREKAAGDEDAANDVKRLRGEKKVLQAQLECKTRQLKVSILLRCLVLPLLVDYRSLNFFHGNFLSFLLYDHGLNSFPNVSL